ncbi:hypothetical protein J1N35_033920 [Gossypium stocksii]|uniref:Uncharacterized protein n=1 Tax=Gossypium stocksii TaxID=47602 RepID=A0A9D3ZQ24_9ROSI|nr:hypothetical protein J1N35_033920 [Gossypium stocksii]
MGIAWFEGKIEAFNYCYFSTEGDNLALKTKVMDLVTVDGSHNSGNNGVDSEVKGGFFVGSNGKRHMQLPVENVD